MITYRRATATALAILTTAALTAGCTHDPNAAPTASTRTAAPTGTPSPAPTVDRVSSPVPTPVHTPLTPLELGMENAGQTVVAFWRVTDQLSSDPYTSLNKLATVSRGQTTDPWRQMLIQQRRAQETQKGRATVRITNTAYRGNNLYAVKACIDVSKVDIVDKHGKSVVSKTRAPRVSYDYTVQKATDGRFYVVNDKLVATC